MSDRIFAGIWLLLCVGGMFIAWQIHSEYAYEPVGPRPFPVGIIGLMLLCSVLLLLAAARRNLLARASGFTTAVDDGRGIGGLCVGF